MMQAFKTFAYYLRHYSTHGMRLLWRNRVWTMLLGVVMVLLLTLCYMLAALSQHARDSAQRIDDNLLITAIVAQNQSGASITPAEQLQKEISSIIGVRSVRVVDRAEARNRFVSNVKNLEAVPSVDAFPQALEIKVSDVKQIRAVRDQVAKWPGIEQASYLGEIAERLTAMSGYVRTGAWVMVVILGMVSLLVLMAVVRAQVLSEQGTLETMASVGASSWVIALPMAVHLMLIAFIASLVACLAGYWIDPHLTGAMAASGKLPQWLDTGRAFGFMQLLPALLALSFTAVAVVLGHGVRSHTRRLS
jgi:cell division transport system permease protein